MKQTKNLNLEYYDPSTDGHLNYDFDVEKRNLEKIDAHVGTPKYGKKENVIGSIIDNDAGNGVAWPEVEGLTLVNSLRNGDFRDGSKGWQAYQSTLAMSDNTVTVTATDANPSLYQPFKFDGQSTYFIYAKARAITGDSDLRIELTGGSGIVHTVSSPITNKWYELRKKVVAASGTNVEITYRSTTLAGEKYEVQKGVVVINMTALGIQDYTEAQMLDLVQKGYIDGLQSVQNPQIKSLGKNLFNSDDPDNEREKSLNNNGETAPQAGKMTSGWIRVKPNTAYYGVASNHRMAWYDADKNHLGYAEPSGSLRTTGNGAYWARIVVENDKVTTTMLTETSKEVPFLPYESTGLKANTELLSLPNGVKDKLYRSGEGNWLKNKRICQYVLQAKDISLYTSDSKRDIVLIPGTVFAGKVAWKGSKVDGSVLFPRTMEVASLTDATDMVGKFALDGDDTIRYGVAKNKYTNVADARADLAGTVIQYQLATPITENVSVKGALEAIPGGKFYNTSDTFSGPLTLTYPTNTAARVQRNTDEAIAVAASSDHAVYGKKEGIIGSVVDNDAGDGITWPEIQGLTLVNSAKNGDFSDGTTSWNANGASGSVSNHKYAFTARAQFGSITQTKRMNTGDEYFAYIQVKSSGNNGNLSLGIHDGKSFIIAKYTPANGQWSEMYGKGVAANTGSNGYISLNDQRASGWSEIQARNVCLINMTALGIEIYTEAEMLDLVRQGYINGVQGVQNPEVKSVGENLLDVYASTDNSMYNRLSNKVMYLPSDKRWVLSAPIYVEEGDVLSSNQVGLKIGFYSDENWAHLNTDTGAVWAASGDTITVPKGQIGWTRFNLRKVINEADYGKAAAEQNIMITKTASPQAFKPHEASKLKAHTTLHRLPNGVKDRLYRGDDGKWRKDKRINEYVLKSSDIDLYGTSTTNVDYVQIGLNALPDIVSQSADVVENSMIVEGFGKEIKQTGFDNASKIGLIATNTTVFILIVPKGKYANLAAARADLAGTVIRYQLANPTTEYVGVEGTLEAIPKGKFYNTSDTFSGLLKLSYPTNKAGKIQRITDESKAGASNNDHVTYGKTQSTLKAVMTNTLGRRIAWPEIEGLTLVNSVKNGDFRDGTTGWSVPSGATVSNNAIKYTIATRYGGPGQSIKASANEIWFAAARVKVTGSSNGVYLLINDAKSQTTKAHSGNGKYEFLYLKHKIHASPGSAFVKVQDGRTSGWTETSVNDVVAINMTALGIEHYTEEQMLNLVHQGYINGLQGVQNPEIMSVGENLFNINANTKFMRAGDSILPNKIRTYTNAYFKSGTALIHQLKPNTQYTFKEWFSLFGQATGVYQRIVELDGNDNAIRDLAYMNTSTSPATRSFTTGQSGKVAIQFDRLGGGNDFLGWADFHNMTLQEGGSVDEYTPYESSRFKAYTTLHSLPNGTKDKLYRDGDGKWRKDKRLREYVLQNEDIDGMITSGINVDLVRMSLGVFDGGINLTNDIQSNALFEFIAPEYANDGLWDTVSRIGGWYSSVSGYHYIIVAKGKYPNLAAARADLTGTKTLYQLANPIQELVAVENDLHLYNTIHNKATAFGGNLTLHYPTNALGKIEESSKTGSQGSDKHELQLKNGWVHYGSDFDIPNYSRDSEGFVTVEMAIKNGTTTALTELTEKLPMGFRPRKDIQSSCVSNGAFGFIDVLKDGRIRARSVSSTLLFVNVRFKAVDTE